MHASRTLNLKLEAPAEIDGRRRNVELTKLNQTSKTLVVVAKKHATFDLFIRTHKNPNQSIRSLIIRVVYLPCTYLVYTR